jgi:glucose-1-phosphate thymidylyltransferase
MNREWLGLVPAGGCGSRIGPLPCSKELLPLGLAAPAGGMLRPKPLCLNLIEAYAQAGIRDVCFALRYGKWDIPAYFGSGADFGLSMSYVVARETWGVPFTADAAWPVTRGRVVAFGFPDILFGPADLFSRLRSRWGAGGACDVLLAALPVTPGQPADMLQTDESGRLAGILVKPAHTDLKYAWVAALWGPAFTEFLHDFCDAERNDRAAGSRDPAETQLSDLYVAAMASGLRIGVETVADGWWLDAGTPGGFAEATRMLAGDDS